VFPIVVVVAVKPSRSDDASHSHTGGSPNNTRPSPATVPYYPPPFPLFRLAVSLSLSSFSFRIPSLFLSLLPRTLISVFRCPTSTTPSRRRRGPSPSARTAGPRRPLPRSWTPGADATSSSTAATSARRTGKTSPTPSTRSMATPRRRTAQTSSARIASTPLRRSTRSRRLGFRPPTVLSLRPGLSTNDWML